MSDALQPDDRQLLRRFAADRSEAAFGELVTRHVTLVYSAALRQTGGDAHRAQDIAQLVFTDLARKAPDLAENVVLAGWLHRATIFAARQILRSERRRRAREQEAVTMNTIESEMTHDEWTKIGPLLDEALQRLNQTDRDALLLRFFEQQSLAQIGTRLGSNEDAARKRVQRALEKLRIILAKRGVTTTAAALSVAITANAMPAAPAGLALTLTNLSLTAAGTGTLTLLQIMTATKIKLAFSALIIASVATALVVQHQTQNKLHEENAAQQQQIVQLQAYNAGLSNRLADTGDSKTLTDEQFNELLKLRGEVGVLRRQINELNQSSKQNHQASKQVTPEMQKAIDKFTKQNEKMNDARIYCAAIQQYILVHNGQTPDNLDQLQPYMGISHLSGTNDFEIIPQGKITDASYPEIMIVLREKEALEVHDTRLPGSNNGKKTWARLYGFANGDVKTESSDDGNFDDFEKKHIFLSPQNQ